MASAVVGEGNAERVGEFFEGGGCAQCPVPVAGGQVALGLPHTTLGAVGGVDLGGMCLVVASGEADGLPRRA